MFPAIHWASIAENLEMEGLVSWTDHAILVSHEGFQDGENGKWEGIFGAYRRLSTATGLPVNAFGS